MRIPVLSIIIPIYNVESYLSTCLNSILHQTYTQWEAILVDDGSTDNSGEIARAYANKDNRFHYYKKPNGGLSSARNYGIDKSHGYYIIFVDSDDYWISETCLSELIEKISKNDLDVVRGEYIRVHNHGEIYEHNATTTRNKKDITSKGVIDSYEMMASAIQGEYFSWLFIFKRIVFNNIRFDEKRKFQEDIDFAIRLFCRNLRCGYIPTPFYAYRQREHSSIMTTPRLTNLYYSFSLSYVFWKYIDHLEDKRLKEEYIYNGIMMYYWTLETASQDIYYKHFKEIQNQAQLKELRKDAIEWIKQTKNKSFPIHFYFSPRNGARLFRLRRHIGSILRKLHLIK